MACNYNEKIVTSTRTIWKAVKLGQRATTENFMFCDGQWQPNKTKREENQ